MAANLIYDHGWNLGKSFRATGRSVGLGLGPGMGMGTGGWRFRRIPLPCSAVGHGTDSSSCQGPCRVR